MSLTLSDQKSIMKQRSAQWGNSNFPDWLKNLNAGRLNGVINQFHIFCLFLGRKGINRNALSGGKLQSSESSNDHSEEKSSMKMF